jgi:amino acid adenylation domain-containing protein
VAAQAVERPDAIALTDGESSLTYGELDGRAVQLARHLRSLGVGNDVLVGICLPRSFEMAVAALAVWKAGGAYVPMDPAYPADRLKFMLSDAQAPVLLTESSYAGRLGRLKQKIVDPRSFECNGRTGEPAAGGVEPSQLAYVIYTSGSTGTPKGVEITHAGLANLVGWHQSAFAVTAADRASHVAGLGFDAAVWELWPYLANGASVHLADDAIRSSAELLKDWLVARRITISFVPTPIAERLITSDWPSDAQLRILLTGGDALHHYPSGDLPFVVINNYGPTECTVVATSGQVLPADQSGVLPSIGRPIENTQIYLLDEGLNPAPDGQTGEIHIGGASLARGYHKRPDLTAEKFVPNPFSAEPDARLYKTGDLARWLPDGSLEFVGRVDDQIKIRGYRIEPNEIVSALSRRAEIRDCMVVAREDTPGDKRLVAYVVLADSACPAHAELSEFLRGSLPEYMLPAAYVRMDELPLTLNGKIDRTTLPAPDAGNTLPQEAVSEGPQTPTEQRLVEILTGLLKVENIGRTDNFFMLGGHSLLGAQLIAQIRNIFGVEMSLRSLFDSPEVATLSAEIDRIAASGPNRIPTLRCAEANS